MSYDCVDSKLPLAHTPQSHTVAVAVLRSTFALNQSHNTSRLDGEIDLSIVIISGVDTIHRVVLAGHLLVGRGDDETDVVDQCRAASCKHWCGRSTDGSCSVSQRRRVLQLEHELVESSCGHLFPFLSLCWNCCLFKFSPLDVTHVFKRFSAFYILCRLQFNSPSSLGHRCVILKCIDMIIYTCIHVLCYR